MSEINPESVIKSDDLSSLQTIIDSLPVATLIIGTRGFFIDISKAALSMFMASDREDIVGHSPIIISPQFQLDGRDSDEKSAHLIDIARNRGSVTFYWTHKRLNGENFPAKVTLSVGMFEGQQAIVSCVEDLSGQVLIEENNAIIHDNPHAILAIGPDKKIIDANPAFTEISGYNKDAWIGRSIKELPIINREGATIEEAIEKKMRVSGKFTVEFNGRIKCIEYSYLPAFDFNGELLKVFNVFSDITDVTEKVSEITSFIRECPAAICTVDLNGHILSANPAYTSISGYSEDKLTSMSLSEFTVLNRDGSGIPEVISSKKPLKGRAIIDFAGDVRILDYTYIPVLDLNNSVKSIMGMYTDLTEHLVYNEEMKSFIENNPYVIFTFNNTFTEFKVNPAFMEVTGYSADQVKSFSYKDFKIVKRMGKTAEEVLSSGKTDSGRIIVDLPTGIKYFKYVMIPVKDANGEYNKIIEILADQTKLIENLNIFDTLINEIPISLMTMDLSGNIKKINPETIKMTGYSKERLSSMNISDFNIISQNGPYLKETITSKKVCKGSLVIDFEDRVKCLSYVFIPVKDVNGEIIEIILSYLDDTEQIEHIEEINRFIENNPYAIITLDLDMNITQANPAFSKMSGFSIEKLSQMNLHEFTVLERHGKSAEEVILSKQEATGHIIINFETGIKQIEYTYVPLPNQKGEIEKLIEIFADRTELVQKLKESETLIVESPALILTTNIIGKILSVNKAFVDITGIPKEKLLSMNLSDFNIISRDGRSINDATISKRPETGNISVDFGHGTKIFDAVYIPIFEVNGEINKIVIMYTDVTVATKMLKYLDDSINEIFKNLSDLSNGKTDFTTQVLPADKEIESAKEQFVKITKSVEVARDAIAKVVEDSTAVVDAMIKGNLSYRVNASVHKGDYQKVIDGMNETLIHTEGPIREVMRISGEFANQNFAAKVDRSQNAQGDWIVLGDALDEVGERISAAIAIINKNVTRLIENTNHANHNVGEIAQGASIMANSASEVSANAEAGNNGIAQMLKAMEDLTITVGDVSKKTEEVSDLSRNATELAHDGTTLARKAEDGMKSISISADDMNRLIGEIQQDMGQIGKIVTLISDIASQTNLLALNAAIEAARAGDAGRGFAVVAAEVKALATESRSSAESIAEMISSLQNKSELAGKSANGAAVAVKEGNEALVETLGVFGKLVDSVEGISLHIEQVAAMSEEQASSTEEITATVNEISNLLEGNAKQAVDIAGGAEESAASLDELRRIIGHVGDETKDVADAVSNFRI